MSIDNDGYFFDEADLALLPWLEYGTDYGTCDLCGKSEPWDDLTPNWNGETGNHKSCEATMRHLARVREQGVR